ncbi:GNAT family N-acetyltransferase [Carboxylicivirga sp. RSCT41]|uniref:GNAT family N-acetyltransferase n=1 Tax=Carboxylicivirga agarovorans TaxID=3417570 RepID=UPI003D3326A3
MTRDEIALRALEPEDIDLLYKWENDMKIWEVSNTLTPFSKYQLVKYIEQAQLDVFQTKQLRLIIESERSKEVIGMIDLFDFDGFHQRGGVGIIIHEDHRQKGYAFEALRLFSDYCFQHLGINQLYANISAENKASLTLFEKVGFKLVGVKKKWRKTKDGFIDECLYQLLK